MPRQPITGMSCDADHPFPAPAAGRWIDSMDYGDTRRLIASMYDRDTLPVWRLFAAWMWGTDCTEQHAAEVAADPILTTYLIASTALAIPPESMDATTRLGFDHVGAGAVFQALRSGGLADARRMVDGLPTAMRVTATRECLAHLGQGVVALQLDAGARFHG